MALKTMTHETPVAIPDRTEKNRVYPEMSCIPSHVTMTETIGQAIAWTTIVRTAVAMLESTSLMPILAEMDVSTANTAERIAKTDH